MLPKLQNWILFSFVSNFQKDKIQIISLINLLKAENSSTVYSHLLCVFTSKQTNCSLLNVPSLLLYCNQSCTISWTKIRKFREFMWNVSNFWIHHNSVLCQAAGQMVSWNIKICDAWLRKYLEISGTFKHALKHLQVLSVRSEWVWMPGRSHSGFIY